MSNLPANLKKGDPLVLVSDSQRETPDQDVVVSRVGRAYVYVRHSDQDFEMIDQFDRVTGAAKKNVGWGRRLRTLEQQAEQRERDRLFAELKEIGIGVQHGREGRVTTEQLRKLYAVMYPEGE